MILKKFARQTSKLTTLEVDGKVSRPDFSSCSGCFALRSPFSAFISFLYGEIKLYNSIFAGLRPAVSMPPSWTSRKSASCVTIRTTRQRMTLSKSDPFWMSLREPPSMSMIVNLQSCCLDEAPATNHCGEPENPDRQVHNKGRYDLNVFANPVPSMLKLFCFWSRCPSVRRPTWNTIRCSMNTIHFWCPASPTILGRQTRPTFGRCSRNAQKTR